MQLHDAPIDRVERRRVEPQPPHRNPWAPGRPPSPSAIAALQRGAGNAAVQQWLTGRTRPAPVQRCGDHTSPGCPCADEHGGADDGRPAMTVQRANIPYGTLAWDDFKGKAPKGTSFAAETDSDYTKVKKAKQLAAATKTGATCALDKAGKKKGDEYRATASVDPATFDPLKSFFKQETSWVKSDVKDGGKAIADGEEKACKKHFDNEAVAMGQTADKQCAELVPQCSKAFAEDASYWEVNFGDKTIKVTSAGDCTKTFPKNCKPASLGEMTPAEKGWKAAVDKATCPDATDPTAEATAKKKDDCSTTFKAPIDTHGKSESTRVLAHEQLHFKVTDKGAEDVKADLLTSVKPLSSQETACGEKKAKDTALATFSAIQVNGQSLKDFILTKQNTATTGINSEQTSYDDQTCHGLDEEKQKEWKDRYFPPPPVTVTSGP